MPTIYDYIAATRLFL